MADIANDLIYKVSVKVSENINEQMLKALPSWYVWCIKRGGAARKIAMLFLKVIIVQTEIKHECKTTERIICAAIRTKRNVIIRGHRHSDCIRAASSRPHITQDDIQYRAEGFITSSGRFVQRVEAMKIAIAAGQYTAEKGRDKLYSEDIY